VSVATLERTSRRAPALALVLLAGAAVAVALGVYGRVHDPKPQPLFNAGFSSYVQFKVWFTTAAAVLVLGQLLTALWMWGRLPGAGPAPRWAAPAHRWSGALAFVLLVPVALNCLYAIGFETTFGARSLVHSIAGCGFYGAYSAKMIGLRVRGLPGWTLPVLGGLLFACFVVLFLTSAVWFFQSGRPLT
jgi:hypothetical protein